MLKQVQKNDNIEDEVIAKLRSYIVNQEYDTDAIKLDCKPNSLGNIDIMGGAIAEAVRNFIHVESGIKL